MSQHFELYLISKTLHTEENPHRGLHLADALEARRTLQCCARERRRFRRLYHLRNLLFRFTPRLAKRLAL